MRSKATAFLVIIIIMAACTRLYRFGSIPKGVNCDEAALGYTTQLLLKTGSEEHGIKWPMDFESFGDWKKPGYIYLSLPLVWIFGLSPTSTRMLSFLSGLGIIIMVYLLAIKLFPTNKGKLIGLVAACLSMINPWQFFSSHIALEAFVATFIFICGFYFLIQQKKVSVVIGLLLFLLSIQTYHAALIFIPLWFAGYMGINLSIIKKNKFLLSVSIFFIGLIIIILAQSWFSNQRDKATGTTIFSMTNEEKWSSIYQYRTNSVLSKIINSQYVYFSTTFVKNYFQDLSVLFLFPKDSDTVPGYTNFLGIETIFLIVGVFWIIKSRNKSGWLLLIALLAAPIPAALTKGIHNTRLIFLIPVVQLISAIGFSKTIAVLTSKKQVFIITAISALLLSIQSIMFYDYFFNNYQKTENRYFADYMEDISKYVYRHQNHYETIVFTYPFEHPHIFYAFYNNLDTKIFQESIQYYPVDRLGFRYAKKLLNMEYIERTKDLSKLDAATLDKILVISRFEEVPNISPVFTWNDQGGRPQIVAVEGKELFGKPSK